MRRDVVGVHHSGSRPVEKGRGKARRDPCVRAMCQSEGEVQRGASPGRC